MKVASPSGSIHGSPAVFLSPDASRTGAPIALLHMLRWFEKNTNLRFEVVLYQDGELASEFAALAPTLILTKVGVRKSGLVKRIGRIPVFRRVAKALWNHVVTPRVVNQRPSVVYANSVAAARLLRQVVPPGCPVVVHVHELEYAIQTAAGPQGMAAIKALASRYVAMAGPVRQNLIDNHGIEPDSIELIPSFIRVDESIAEKREEHQCTVRQSLNIPDNALVVMACGATDHRKGVDLFIEMAGLVNTKPTEPRVHFVWVGRILDDDFTCSAMERIKELGLSGVFHLVGEQPRPVEFFCGCDLFVLSSREEPMGLVALEAATVGRPIVCFAEAGGMAEFVADECGRVVSPMTGQALANAVLELLSSSEMRNSMGHQAFDKVRRVHHIDTIAPRILSLVESVARN